MVWIRFGRIRAIWRCTTTRGYETKYHAIGVALRDEYQNRPTESIEDWAKRIGDITVEIICRNSCQSLSTSVFCDESSREVEIIYTSETLVARPIARIEVPTVPHVEPEPTIVSQIPTFILDQISLLEERFVEAESVDEKLAIRDEINRLKTRYDIT